MRIDNVTFIIERFADAGFTVPEIIALLVSHTIAAAVRSQLVVFFVNTETYHRTMSTR
jgi:hypothetical protein